MSGDPRALIVGVGGQDGAYLARHLLGLGYRVFGTSRSAPTVPLDNLERLGIASGVERLQLETTDAAQMDAAVAAAEAGEIYYLAAQSSVARSFGEPAQSMVDVLGFARLLEATRGAAVRIFNASSGDCFGDTTAEAPATEATPLAPRSPYAIAKTAQHQLGALVRKTEGRFIATAYLFNHESPLRPAQFVTGRVIAAAKRIAAGSDETLELGDVGVVRDWGWAPEYVVAMQRMLTLDTPEDFVLATGRSVPLAHFVERVFAELGLDWRAHVRSGAVPPRPWDVRLHHGDPGKAARLLGWRATRDVDAVVRLLVAGAQDAADGIG